MYLVCPSQISVRHHARGYGNLESALLIRPQPVLRFYDPSQATFVTSLEYKPCIVHHARQMLVASVAFAVGLASSLHCCLSSYPLARTLARSLC